MGELNGHKVWQVARYINQVATHRPTPFRAQRHYDRLKLPHKFPHFVVIGSGNFGRQVPSPNQCFLVIHTERVRNLDNRFPSWRCFS